MPKDLKTAVAPASEDTGVRDESNGGISPGAEAPGNGSDAGRSGNESASQAEARLHRIERQQEELIKIMAEALAGNANDDDEPASSQSIVSGLRERIPTEGYEGAAPLFSGILDALDELRTSVAQVSAQKAQRDPTELFEMFQEMNPDLPKYDGTMANIAKTFDIRPSNYKQLRALKAIAQAVQEHPNLKAELASAKKSGAVPNLAPAAPGLRERLASLRQTGNGQPKTIGDRMLEGLREAKANGTLSDED